MIRDRKELQQFLDYCDGFTEAQEAAREAFEEQQARRVPRWENIPAEEQPDWLDKMATSPWLTAWEREFSIEFFERDQDPSEKQLEILNRLLSKLRRASS